MRIGNTLFYLIIGLQALAALFAIRIWPLTDYPMFSLPKPPFTSVSRFAVEEVYSDHTYLWQQLDYQGIGSHSSALQFLIDKPDHPDIDLYLKQAVQAFSFSKKQNPPHKLRLLKRTFSIQPSGKFLETKDFLREMSYAEISK